MTNPYVADVCLVLEGTYPYVSGGVSSWVHQIISGCDEITFHLVTLSADSKPQSHKYKLPDNVTGITQVAINEPPHGKRTIRRQKKQLGEITQVISQFFNKPSLTNLENLSSLLSENNGTLGKKVLLDSPEAWQQTLNTYERGYKGTPFLDFFWSWRSILTGIYSTMLAPIPKCRTYHTISTGYAGLYAARAHLEQKRPALITEHGIYNSERRIEIMMADWLFDRPGATLNIDSLGGGIRQLWIRSFSIYSKMCYAACSKIVTLYEENQALQVADGAQKSKLNVIPNGVDYPFFSSIHKEQPGQRGRIAMIGRVVPIKDIKTFINACHTLKQMLVDFDALIMGPMDEDTEYAEECISLVERLNLNKQITFTGKVNIADYLGSIDVMVLTSISEAQPLVILEAGAVNIPTVATEVGNCRDLIMGKATEQPPLGPGGCIVPPSNPEATAEQIAVLLESPERLKNYGNAIKERVRKYYDRTDMIRSYRELYKEHLN